MSSIEPDVRYELKAYVEDELVYKADSHSSEIIEMALGIAEQEVQRTVGEMQSAFYEGNYEAEL